MLTLYKKKSDDEEDVPSGYEDLMKRCLEHIAGRRPLIDVVRVDLQGLMEIAAEIDRRDRHYSYDDDGGVESKEKVDSDDKALLGVHIEMGTISSSTTISSRGDDGDDKKKGGDELEILLEI